ncbi:hypothetical protein PsYK624_128800 [Phanerochaete sordida]|uniref:Uncharacterized protein n=1 Tax=Phanerochaete sordida TaxID=48140 RepID=A0A9P3GIS5_9APHY|nr:hypothetical protein PsYK624_128800 [Phanerochaete sordida]
MFTPVDGVKPDMLRGCRHYSVDDSREDMEALLEMIYNGLRVESVTLTAETFPVLSSLLHMCTKYEVERPRPEIVARIQACWPDNLAQHDAVNDARVRKYMDAHANQYPQGTILPYVDDDTDVHPAAIIALLRQCGYTEPKLFAPLFYALSRCAKGFGGVAGSNISPLSHTDVERLLVGIERLRADHLKKTVVVLTGEPAHANYCGAALATFSSTRLSLAAAQALSSPVEFWGGAAKLIMQAAGQPPAAPCAVCCTLVANSILEGRNALWARMPEVFDLS